MTTASNDSNLVRTTLRTVALLVGACVLFVGVLSVVAVAVTSRVVRSGAAPEARTTEADPQPPAKKPLSI